MAMEKNAVLAALFGLDGKHILLHLDTLGVKIDSEGDVTGVRLDDDVVSVYTSDAQVFFELNSLSISSLEDDDTNKITYFFDNHNGVVVEMEELDAPS